MSIILGFILISFGCFLILFELAPMLGWFELVVGCGLLVFGGVRNWERIQYISKKSIGLATIIVLLVLALSEARYGREYSLDLTAQRKFSLTESTKRAVGNLSRALTLYFLPLGEVTRIEEERKLLQRYMQLGSKLEVVEVDPVRDISIIERYSMKGGDRLIVVDGDGDKVHLSTIDERSLTTAFQTLTNQKAIRLRYVIGHGEAELRGSGPLGLSRMREFLNGQGVQVDEVGLSGMSVGEQEAELLLLVAPQKPLSEEEEIVLEDYFEAGGSILLALDDSSLVPRVVLRAGVERSLDPIIRMVRSDAQEEKQFSYELSVTIFKSHPVTSFLKDEASVLFSSAYPLHLTQPTNSRLRDQLPVLFLRSQKKGQVGSDQHVLTAVAESESGGRLAVVGDSSWLRNHLIERAYNQEFLKGLIFWGSHVEVIGRNLEEKGIVIDNAALKSGARSALLAFVFTIQFFALLWILSVFRRSQNHV